MSNLTHAYFNATLTMTGSSGAKHLDINTLYSQMDTVLKNATTMLEKGPPNNSIDPIGPNFLILMSLIAVMLISCCIIIFAIYISRSRRTRKRMNTPEILTPTVIANMENPPTALMTTDMNSKLSAFGTDMSRYIQTTFIDPGTHIIAMPGYMELQWSWLKPLKQLNRGGEGIIEVAELSNVELVSKLEESNGIMKRDSEGNVLVIVKTLILKQQDTQEAIALPDIDKFRQEMSITSSLQDHANIVKLIGYVEAPQLAIVLFMYDGSLQKLIDDSNMVLLPLLDLACQIADGLSEIHRAGITHCDMKPGNILFLAQSPSTQNQDGLPAFKLAITDFGISQVKLSSEKVRTRRNVRVPAASISYSSPEILTRLMGPEDLKMEFIVPVTLTTGERRNVAADEAEPSRDIYSFAIIFWELIARQLAWHGMKSVEIYNAVSIQGARPPVPYDCFEGELWTDDEYLAESFDFAEQYYGRGKMVELIQLIKLCWEGDCSLRPESSVILSKLKELT